jgi:hypothetical protein
MGEVRTDTVATSEDAERDPSVQVNLSVHQRGTSALMNGLGRPGPPPGRYDLPRRVTRQSTTTGTALFLVGGPRLVFLAAWFDNGHLVLTVR